MQNQVYKKANGEEVDRASWAWAFTAVYDDGSELPQFNDNTGEAKGFFDIDQSRLVQFRMERKSHSFTLDFPKGAKLIHFRRTTRLNAQTYLEQEIVTYGFGFEIQTEDDGNIVDLYHLVEQIGGNWLLVHANAKDSMRWITDDIE